MARINTLYTTFQIDLVIIKTHSIGKVAWKPITNCKQRVQLLASKSLDGLDFKNM